MKIQLKKKMKAIDRKGRDRIMQRMQNKKMKKTIYMVAIVTVTS